MYVIYCEEGMARGVIHLSSPAPQVYNSGYQKLRAAETVVTGALARTSLCQA